MMMTSKNIDFQPEQQSARSEMLSAQSASTVPIAFPAVTQNILTTLLDLSPDALVVVDVAGTITMVNTQTEMLFGYSQNELVGRALEILLPEHLRVVHAARRTYYMHAACPRSMGIGLDLVGRGKDGSEFPVDISLRPILIGNTIHVVGAVRSMMAQCLNERERIYTAKRLRQQDQLISLAHDAILVRDPDSHICSWNEGAEHLYGWTAQEVMGKVTHTLLQTSFPVSLEAIEQALEQHGRWEGDLIHTCRDGRKVIVESRHVLTRNEQGVPTAILEINRDVTERRRLELVEQEAYAEKDARLNVLQMILDRFPSGVCLLQGPQLRLLLINQAAKVLWGAEWQMGQSREDFLRQQGVRFFATDGRPIPSEDSPVAQAMASGEPVLHYQLVIRRPDGTRFPVLLDAIPLEHFQQLRRLPQEMSTVLAATERVVLLVFYDVARLKEAEALKDQFIGLATHELRTPVTVIAGYTDLLLKRAARTEKHRLDEWQISKMHEMKLAAQQLANLTEDLLDVTRLQAGQFRLDLHSTDLVALTRQVVERLQTTTTSHQLSFHTVLEHLWAAVDALRIEQVLSNLLSNAIKYSPKGGPIEVTLQEEMQTKQAYLSICDHGIGIPREQQAYLFTRFMRADNARAARIRGTGLGLYLCQELVERHGGHICFDSEEGVGSTFFIALPLTNGIN
jgi:PAS domain S-box-containing protein